jgi:hypothetical protein
MTYGYHCEECEDARNREHVVREVAAHVSGGLDTWMMESLAFLDRHSGHSIVITSRP